MSRTAVYSVWYERGSSAYKVFKVGFSADGSYFVTAPYHPLDTALVAKVRVNYTKQGIPLRDAFVSAQELRVLDQDSARLKLSHHPSGFLQFSGSGIISGRDEAGVIRGIGVDSWRLQKPTFGPSFAVYMFQPDRIGRLGSPAANEVVVPAISLEHMRTGDRFMDVRFVGHYFPPRFRSFVKRTHDGRYYMSIVNPESNVVLDLQVILASTESTYPGLIGIWAEPHELGIEGFVLSSSTGNLHRHRLSGDLVGDQLMCMYPRPSEFTQVGLDTLNFEQLPTPPYSAPPGSPILPSQVGRSKVTNQGSRRKRKGKG